MQTQNGCPSILAAPTISPALPINTNSSRPNTVHGIVVMVSKSNIIPMETKNRLAKASRNGSISEAAWLW